MREYVKKIEKNYRKKKMTDKSLYICHFLTQSVVITRLSFGKIRCLKQILKIKIVKEINR